MHLGMAECHIPFAGHCDLDLGLVVQLKQKCLLMKSTYDDIVKANEVHNQLSFERHKGKLMLCN